MPLRPNGPTIPIGRDREAAELTSALTDPRWPVVVLHGLPGMGAVDLAAAVWHGMTDRARPGVRVVDADQTESALLDLLRRPADETGPGLVVLDRADDATGHLGEMAAGLPAGTRLVACAIRRPTDPRVHPLAVGPLPLPDPGDRIDDSPAIRLFLQHADLGPAEAVDDDAPAVAELCRIAAGWPLLIETIASWTGTLPPEALVDRLGSRPELLFQPAWDSRRRTGYLPSVRAALEYTWRHLPAPERAAMRAACLFRGAATAADLGAVAGLTIGDATRAVHGLATCGLLTTAGSDRFRATATAGEFARHKFDRALPARTARRRYVDVVCAKASRAVELFDGGDEAAATLAARDDIADYLPAMTLLREAGQTSRALRLAGDAAPGLSQAGRFVDAARCIDELLRADGLSDSAELGDALIGYADLMLSGVVGVDVRELAYQRLDAGVAMVRRCGTPRAQLRALAAACNAWPVTQDPAFGARCVHEGLALARRVGSARWLARFEAWSGMLAHQQGEPDRAAAWGARALARARRCGDRRGRLLAGILLQTLPETASEIPGGLPTPEDLLGLAAELVEPRLQSVVLAILADRAVRAGRWDDAAYWCAQALELVGSLDTWYGAGFAVMFLTAVAAGRGELAEAARLHGMVMDRLAVLTANMPPHAAAEYRDLVSGLRSAGDAEEFDRLARSGAVLPWRDAAAAALQYTYRVGAAAPPAGPQRPAATSLTPREAQVLSLIAEGQDTRSIADRLRISVRSASHHTGSVLRKLGVSNRTQAAIWATQHPDGLATVVTHQHPDALSTVVTHDAPDGDGGSRRAGTGLPAAPGRSRSAGR